MPYKLSKYNCIKVGEKAVAVYNTFSNGMAVLESNEYNKLQLIHEYDSLDNDIREWINLGFVVEADKEESAIVNYCRYRDVFLRNRPTFRILTTSACNARCFYCYEKGRPVQTMSKETATTTADFIIRSTEDAKEIMINWFGGEPLLNPDAITLIMQRLKTALNGKKIDSSIITNASLFTKELIDLSKKEWNLSHVQITLDGMETIHEKRKAYIDNCCSFHKTIATIGLLLSKEFNVSLRLNYDKDNFADIIKLIYFIHENFSNPSNLICYAFPLFNINRNDKRNSYIYGNETSDYNYEIINALTECGYYNPTEHLSRRTTACFATDPYSYVINTDGLLYKCTMDKMEPSHSVGNVWSGVMLNNTLIEWTTPVLPKQCQACELLPICQGGCRASRILNIDMCGCKMRRQIIENTLIHLLKTATL